MPIKLVAAIAFALLLQACAADAPQGSFRTVPDPFLIVPGKRVGLVTKDTDEAALRRAYGGARVQPYDVEIGEGLVCRGARVAFGHGHSMAITWRDPKTRSGALSVFVKGSKWRTKEGVRLGISLKQLERINGGPFMLTGFAWDYSGTVVGWRGGRLAHYGAPRRKASIVLRLGPGQAGYDRIEREGWGQLIGDHDLSSTDPGMQALNPRAYLLQVFLRPGRHCKSFRESQRDVQRNRFPNRG